MPTGFTSSALPTYRISPLPTQLQPLCINLILHPLLDLPLLCLLLHYRRLAGVRMDLATDVFIPEDYVRSRHARKMPAKQQANTSVKVSDAHNIVPFEQKTENSHGMYGGFNKEEIIFTCLTP
ncbi:hypothetical protein SUGI_0133570 [Cryptomeria japonica]|nr:hypothetical protein SUGI_0133570 [Cryptomeria japonica]